MVRIGLLGAGFMGSTHAAICHRMPNAELVAVADANRAQADDLARKYGARACYDVESLLAAEDIDAVDVCVPTFLHEQCVVGAAQASKHVLCEKPVALSLEQVDNMIAAVERADVSAMVGQVIRFWPAYMAIRDLLYRGELGEPRAIAASRLSAPPAWGRWFKDPELSGGAVLDLHIHDLDFVCSLMGMPQTVYAVGLQGEMGGWDHVTTSLSYPGTAAVVEGSFLMPEGFPFQMLFRLFGSEATAEYRFRVLGQVGERDQAESELRLYRPGRSAEPIATEDKDAYANEAEYFVECIADGRRPGIATLPEARDVLRIALSARQSLESGEAVAL